MIELISEIAEPAEPVFMIPLDELVIETPLVEVQMTAQDTAGFMIPMDVLLAEPVEPKPVAQEQKPKKVRPQKIYSSITMPKSAPVSAIPHIEAVVSAPPTPPTPPPPSLDRSKAFATFQKYYSKLEQAATTMSDHMRWCSGTDGHKKPTQKVTRQTLDNARERAFTNIMNTGIGKKLAETGEISAQEEKALLEIAALATDRELGTSTTNVVRAVNERVDTSWHDQNIEAVMMMEMNQGHVHGAGCDHGGATSIMSSSVMQGTHSVFSSSSHGHEGHDKLYVCSGCSKTRMAHVHGNEKVTCKCGSTMTPASKKRKTVD